jgi:long-chain acyl-CoA synthetase
MRKTILSFLEDHADRNSGAAFAYWRGLRVEVWQRARVAETAIRFARELEARSIGKGDRVLFMAANSPQWVAAFFGCLLRGVIVVPLDETSAPDFLKRVLKQTDAKLLLYGAHERPQFDESLPGLNLQELAQSVAHHPANRYTHENIGEDDIVEIIYTSGTTTEPKGVILTHRNLLANLTPLEAEVRKYLKWERLVHPLRFLNLLPLSHIFGQFMGIFVPQLLGGMVFFQDSLNPSEIINTARKRHVNVIVTVPRLLDTLREKIERECERDNDGEGFRRNLERAEEWHFLRRWWAFRRVHGQFGWRLWAFISGGASLAPETESFWQRMGFAVVQGYGMTETASLISVNHPFKKSRGSIGKTLPGQEVKLDESGEIMVRGRNISPGYWNGDSAASPGSDEGWLRTGDIGELDAAGNLFFKGRLKDVIVTAAGLNIYAEDLEAALKAQPEVRDCAVVAIETARGPEAFAALIMRAEATDLSVVAAAAVERANRTLAQPQQVRHWLVWPEPDFPRTPTHKVMRRKVAEMLKAHLAGHLSQVTRTASALAETISRLTGNVRAPLDSSANLATDLKLDSLGRVELLSALEDRYQIEIDEAAFTTSTTLGDVERMLHQGSRESATPAPYPYPEWAQRAPVTWIRLITFYLLLLPLTRVMCWVRVLGAEHLKGLDGPVLFVSNHITMADHTLILSALPGRFRRRLAIAMEGEILRDFVHPPSTAGRWTRILGHMKYVLVVTLFNVFPLPKKSGFRRSFAYAGEAMDRGQSVLVFPEGKRSEDGLMSPFMTGTGVLAADLHAPVVPIKIEGLFQLKQQKRYFARPRQVTIIFGEPVRFSSSEESTHIAAELEKHVAALKSKDEG